MTINPELLAVVGGVITVIAMVPQFNKIRDTDSTDSFCPISINISLLGTIFFLYYAWLESLPVIFIGSLLSLIFDFYILYKIKNRSPV